MNKTQLLIVSIITSVTGIMLIVLLSPEISPQFIQVHGEVKSVDTHGDVTFITFVPSDFEVVSFNDLSPEGNVTLIGRLQYYKGKLEFVVDAID